MEDISKNSLEAEVEPLEIVVDNEIEIDNSNNLILMYSKEYGDRVCDCCPGYWYCENIDGSSHEESSSSGSESQSGTKSLISDDDSSSDYIPSESEESEEELTEEMLFDFLPIDRQNKLLGVEHYINCAGLSYDPIFMPLYEHLANTEDPVPVRTDWERQKNNFSFIGGSIYDA